MTPDYLPAAILLFFLAIQACFYLFVFSRLLFQDPEKYNPGATGEAAALPGVSIIVCAWNEKENLKELLPLLDAQEYPEYEVLLIDDRSTDGSEELLLEYCAGSAHVRTIRIDEEHDHITPKKYAVTIGQKHARYEITLMTDADCRPVGSHWIASMVTELTEKKEVVLGFSPYLKKKGLLNWLIRCETFYTAVQYLSFALSGFAYMGVGRNLLYRKALFFANRGFYSHNKVLGGDDDLFINQVARNRNVAICLSPESFMYSEPKTTWKSWYHQKKRHLGVGKLYRTRNQVLLGLLSGSHVMVWLITAANVAWAWFTSDLQLLEITLLLFALRWVLQALLLVPINRRLGATIGNFSIPLMDLALFLYYLFMGTRTLFRKRQVARWR